MKSAAAYLDVGIREQRLDGRQDGGDAVHRAPFVLQRPNEMFSNPSNLGTHIISNCASMTGNNTAMMGRHHGCVPSGVRQTASVAITRSQMHMQACRAAMSGRLACKEAPE